MQVTLFWNISNTSYKVPSSSYAGLSEIDRGSLYNFSSTIWLTPQLGGRYPILPPVMSRRISGEPWDSRASVHDYCEADSNIVPNAIEPIPFLWMVESKELRV